MNPLFVTVSFLHESIVAASLDGARSKLDVFADRLAKSTSEPSLALCLEHLLRACHVELERVSPTLAANMMRIAHHPEHGPRVLRWLREQTKTAALLAVTRDKALVQDALETAPLPEPVNTTAAARPRGAFAIGIRALCQAPLAHGADGKLGNATLFRRAQVLASDGSVLHLPFYSGNALRGQLRDRLALHFLDAMGLPARRNAPAVALWFFYALFSGGALEQNSDAQKALRKQLGDHGAIRAEGIREFREHLPSISLLGCALGNRVISGRLRVADLRPVCREWGTGSQPVAEMLSWEFLTRREDLEDHADNHSMIANTEVLRPGTALEGGIDLDACITPLELSALAVALTRLQEHGHLGAENRRGFGKVELSFSNLPDPAPYETYLRENKEKILSYLDAIGALAV